MARTLSWINRIVPIARDIENSACSHYGRKDLQRLFEIQPRSAQILMSALPVVSIGNSHLVQREALGALLKHLNEAEDATKAFALLRSKGAKPVRRKLRTLSLKDVSADLDSLPENLTLSRGEMIVRFETVDQLAETMVCLAALLQDHLNEFSARYECFPKLNDEDICHQEQIHRDAKYIESFTVLSKTI